MKVTIVMPWQNIDTAPTDTPFLGRADGMVAVCIIYDETKRRRVKGRWPWSKSVAVSEEPVQYVAYAMPSAGSYVLMNMRTDMGWYPEEWLSLEEIPW